MDKSQALKKYKKKADVLAGYSDADESFTINSDPDMVPITIYLPEPPDWDLIDLSLIHI